jgi:hypothetical protein
MPLYFTRSTQRCPKSLSNFLAHSARASSRHSRPATRLKPLSAQVLFEVILFTRRCCLCVTKALREAGQAPETKRPAAPLPHPWPHATLRPRKHTRSAATTVVRTYAVRLSNHTRTHSMGSKSGLLLEWMACKSGGVIPPGHPPSSKTKRHYANRQAPQQPRPHKQKAQTQHATAMQAKEFSQLHTTAKRARSTPHPTDATQTGKGHPCKHVSKTHQSSTALK